MTSGLENAGYDVLAGIDNWAPAVDTYSRNFRHPAHLLDLAAVTAEQLIDLLGATVGEIDLLAGGPPCQGFSIQRIGSNTDPRNDLVVHYGRLIAGMQPRTFIMENVPGLLGARGRESMKKFSEIVEAAGYSYQVHRVNAVDFGVPQKRPRVIIYGWSKELNPPEFNLTDVSHRPISVGEAFQDLPPASPPGTKNATDPLHVESRMSPVNKERLRHIPPGGGFEDLPVEMRAECHRGGASKIGHRAVYGRLNSSVPANVITARFDSFTRGRFAHPTEDRNITLREGAKLQTFADDFMFTGNREQIAAQIGNAVPPLVAEKVGAFAVEHLSGNVGSALHDGQAAI